MEKNPVFPQGALSLRPHWRGAPESSGVAIHSWHLWSAWLPWASSWSCLCHAVAVVLIAFLCTGLCSMTAVLLEFFLSLGLHSSFSSLCLLDLVAPVGCLEAQCSRVSWKATGPDLTNVSCTLKYYWTKEVVLETLTKLGGKKKHSKPKKFLLEEMPLLASLAVSSLYCHLGVYCVHMF